MAQHGTVARFTKGCNCEPCHTIGRPANRERSRRSRTKRVTGPNPCWLCPQTFPTTRGLACHMTRIHDGGVR